MAIEVCVLTRAVEANLSRRDCPFAPTVGFVGVSVLSRLIRDNGSMQPKTETTWTVYNGG